MVKRFGTLEMLATWKAVGPLFGAGASDPNGGKLKRALAKEAEKSIGLWAGKSIRKWIQQKAKRRPLSKDEVAQIRSQISEWKSIKEKKKAAGEEEDPSEGSSLEEDSQESGSGTESSEDDAETLGVPSEED